jgi:voltage-gated potassium channel
MARNRADILISAVAAMRSVGLLRLLQFAVLAAGVLALTLFSVPTLRAEHGIWLSGVLWLCWLFFAAEWMVHAWAAHGRGSVAGYVLSAAGMIDAAAVLPIGLAFATGVPDESAWLLGAFWTLKLAPVSPGLSLLGRVIAVEAKPLASVLVLFLAVLFISGATLHVLERDVQPTKFGSVPDGLWWAVVTLTTTGYGDAIPETRLGRVVAGMVMICGIAVFGLVTGILATGFVAEARRRDFIRNWDLVTRVPFFRSLDPKAIIDITHLLRRWDLPENTVVVRRGRQGDCMYFIASGEVEVELQPSPIRLAAGAFFGELALLGGGIRNATVVTTKPTALLILELSDFRTFTAQHPDLARAVEHEAGRRRGEAAAITPEDGESAKHGGEEMSIVEQRRN